LKEKCGDAEYFVSEPEKMEKMMEKDESSEKLKSAVHAFLEKEIKEQQAKDGIDDGMIRVEMDDETGEFVSSMVKVIRNPDGSKKTIKTIQKVNARELDKKITGKGEVKLLKITDMMDIEEEQIGQVPHSGLIKLMEENTTEKVADIKSATESKLKSDEKEKKDRLDYIDPSRWNDITDLFNPAATEIQWIIQRYIDKNPRIMSQMMSMSFSDIVKAFQVIQKKTKNFEETYTILFKGMIAEDAEPYVKRILHEDSEISARDSVTDSLLRGGGVGVENIAKILGKDKINKLVQEYVQNLEKDPKISDETVDKIIDNLIPENTAP